MEVVKLHPVARTTSERFLFHITPQKEGTSLRFLHSAV